MSVPALRRWLLSVIAALGVLTYPEVDLSAVAHDDREDVLEIADSRVSYGEARGHALAELERADRVLAILENERWFEIDDYAKQLEAICGAFLKSHQKSPRILDALAERLSFAFAQLEASTETFEKWRRLALASLPDAEFLPIPARFVIQTSASLTATEPWSAVDFEVWS